MIEILILLLNIMPILAPYDIFYFKIMSARFLHNLIFSYFYVI